MVELDASGVVLRVVGPEELEGSTVALTSFIECNDAVDGALFRAASLETDLDDEGKSSDGRK